MSEVTRILRGMTTRVMRTECGETALIDEATMDAVSRIDGNTWTYDDPDDPATLWSCELAEGHSAAHGQFVQTEVGDDGFEWWVTWADCVVSLARLEACEAIMKLVPVRQDDIEEVVCQLPVGHDGPHHSSDGDWLGDDSE